MRRSIKHTLWMISILCSAWSISTDIYAQEINNDASSQISSIIESLETPQISQGRIRVFQSRAIRALIRLRPSTLNSSNITGGYSVMNGYKVQLYSGNAQNSKTIAQQRSTMVEELFPEFEAELQYKAPFWRVRVGNFITQAEANEFLNVLKKEFPLYGKEMYVVPSTIRIPR